MGVKLKASIDSPVRAPFSWDNLPTSPIFLSPSEPASPPTLWLDARHMKVFGAEPLKQECAIIRCGDCSKPVQRSLWSEHTERCRTIRSGGKKYSKQDGKKRKVDDDDTLEEESGVKKKKPATKITKGRAKGPVDLDKQCGVINDKGLPCSRALTCKSHAMGAKRSVQGRSKDYDDLLDEFNKERNPNYEPPKRISKEDKKKKKEAEKAEKKRLAREAADAAAERKQASGGTVKKTKKREVRQTSIMREEPEDENMDDVDSEAELESMVKAVRTAHAANAIAVPLAVPYDAGSWFVGRRERLRNCKELLASALMPKPGLSGGGPVRLPAVASDSRQISTSMSISSEIALNDWLLPPLVVVVDGRMVVCTDGVCRAHFLAVLRLLAAALAVLLPLHSPPSPLPPPFSRRRASFSHIRRDAPWLSSSPLPACGTQMDDLKRIAIPHHGSLPQFSSDSRRPAAGVFSYLNPSVEAEGIITTRSSARWWPEFHLFEAPRRRPLSSSSNAPPSTLRFCLLCVLWYSSSALSSNTGKAILNQFSYPVTLTFVQFAFVAGYCLLFTSPIIQFSRLKSPTKAVIESTLPMGAFQVGGHILSSVAISRIPVSTTHTIKALSPLFTVIAYAMLFGVKYSWKTYLSLLPLTLGVMLVCSFERSASNILGLTCAFASAIVFVSSNIFFKKVMPSPSQSSWDTSHRLDKLNLLLYSSSMAFALMIPVWMYYDLPIFMSSTQRVSHPAHATPSTSNLMWNFFINGTVHFGQNIIAFIILSSTSPVTYSIASLFKRVAVICIAILWFNQSVHPVQGVGIVLTFLGLWMYNNAKGDVEKGEKKVRRVEAARELMLPSNRADHALMHSDYSPALSENEEELFSASSGVDRNAQLMSPISNMPLVLPQLSSQKDLHVKVALPPLHLHQRKVESPVDSYPSPPLSHDSPPPTSNDLPVAEPQRGRRRSTTASRTHQINASNESFGNHSRISRSL